MSLIGRKKVELSPGKEGFTCRRTRSFGKRLFSAITMVPLLDILGVSRLRSSLHVISGSLDFWQMYIGTLLVAKSVNVPNHVVPS